jgi:hypothetical protein
MVKKKKNTKNGPSLKSLILVVASVLVIVILGISIIYNIYQQGIVGEKEEKISNLQEKIGDLNNQVEEIEISLQEEKEKELVIEKIEYSNEEYNFNLSLPDSWSNYEIEKRTLKFGGNGSADSIDFYFEEDKLIFNLGFIEKDKWDIVKDLSYYQASKIGENEKYVFGYIVPKKADIDLVESLESEIDSIKESFQVTTLLEIDDMGDDSSDDTFSDEEDLNNNDSLEEDSSLE